MPAHRGASLPRSALRRARLDECSGRGEAGHSGPDDDNSHTTVDAQPPASVDAICDDESPDFLNTEYTNANAMTVTPNSTTAAAPTKGFVVLLAVPMT